MNATTRTSFNSEANIQKKYKVPTFEINVYVDECCNWFQSEKLLEDYEGDFAYECLIQGDVKCHDESDVGIYYLEVLDFEITLENAYKGEEKLSLTKEEVRELEKDLKNNIIINAYDR